MSIFGGQPWGIPSTCRVRPILAALLISPAGRRPRLACRVLPSCATEQGECDMASLAGGPPCHLFSGLGLRPRGVSDPRSEPLHHLVEGRWVSGFLNRGSRGASEGTELVRLLVELASMSASFRGQKGGLVASQPVYLNATDWGWVPRLRYSLGFDARLLQARPGAEVTPGDVAAKHSVTRPIPPQPSPPPTHGLLGWWRGRVGEGGRWMRADRGRSGVRAAVPPGAGHSSTCPTGGLMIVTTCYAH